MCVLHQNGKCRKTCFDLLLDLWWMRALAYCNAHCIEFSVLMNDGCMRSPYSWISFVSLFCVFHFDIESKTNASIYFRIEQLNRPSGIGWSPIILKCNRRFLSSVKIFHLTQTSRDALQDGTTILTIEHAAVTYDSAEIDSPSLNHTIVDWQFVWMQFTRLLLVLTWSITISPHWHRSNVQPRSHCKKCLPKKFISLNRTEWNSIENCWYWKVCEIKVINERKIDFINKNYWTNLKI